MRQLLRNGYEKGQAVVEWAIVFPLFLLLMCAIIDFGWFGYQRLMFESAYQMTAWDFTLILRDTGGNEMTDSSIVGGGTPGSYNESTANVVKIDGKGLYGLGPGIKEHMVSGSGGLLKESNLKVKSAKVDFKMVVEPEFYQLVGNELKQYDTHRVNVELLAELEYEIEPLTPIGKNFFFAGGENVIKKNVVRKRNERVIVIREVKVPKT